MEAISNIITYIFIAVVILYLGIIFYVCVIKAIFKDVVIEEIDDEYIKFIHKKMDFSINIPKNWERRREGEFRRALLTANVPRGIIHDNLCSDMDISVFVEKNITNLADLDHFCEYILSRWAQKIQSYKKEKIIINQYDSILVSYPFSDLNIFDVENIYLNKLYFFINKKRGYFIHCSILKDKYIYYKKIEEDIINSFRLI